MDEHTSRTAPGACVCTCSTSWLEDGYGTMSSAAVAHVSQALSGAIFQVLGSSYTVCCCHGCACPTQWPDVSIPHVGLAHPARASPEEARP